MVANLILVSIAPVLYAKGFDHTHARWQSLLQKYVVTHDRRPAVSNFLYRRLLEHGPDRTELAEYIKSIEGVERSTFDRWHRDERLAFLVNAYNALTVQLVLEHFPIASIKDIQEDDRNAWRIRFFILFGVRQHLDYLEHEIIRKYNEPRIHFALNCASKGCPGLSKRAYVAETLDAQLEDATTAFLLDDQRNRYEPRTDELTLSRIFEWFKSDFEASGSTVQQFVAKRLPKVRPNSSILYSEYDWGLNTQVALRSTIYTERITTAVYWSTDLCAPLFDKIEPSIRQGIAEPVAISIVARTRRVDLNDL